MDVTVCLCPHSENRRRSRRRNRRAGFTLIEILVVVAVILILMAFLGTAFVKGKERAQQAGCIANVMQLVTAWNLYTLDNDGFTLVCDAQQPYYKPLWDYSKDLTILRCPDDEKGDWMSYAINFSTSRVRIESLNRDATQVPVFVDSSYEGIWKFEQVHAEEKDSEKQAALERTGKEGRLALRHFDGAIAAYMDGHVKWRPSNLLTPAIFDPSWQPTPEKRRYVVP